MALLIDNLASYLLFIYLYILYLNLFIVDLIIVDFYYFGDRGPAGASGPE